MEIKTKDLLLRTVTEYDVYQVAGMYDYPNTISLKQAEKAINTIINNY